MLLFQIDVKKHVSEYSADKTHCGEGYHYLVLGKAAHFKMMMDRGHFEDTLSRGLEAYYL